MEMKYSGATRNEPEGLSKKANLKLLIVARSKLREVICEQNRAIIICRRGADIAFDVWTLSLYSANRICTTRIDITAKSKVAAALRSVEEIFASSKTTAVALAA
jgi:hypothetical protein